MTETPRSVRKFGRTISSFSILLALCLAFWQVYFFWFSGRHILGPLDGIFGIFTQDRVGINVAWLCVAYLSVQLLSIPFAGSSPGGRFSSVVDGMASLVPLTIVLLFLFTGGKRLFDPWMLEAAVILAIVSFVDLFGGYIFTIALSRRSIDFNN